MSFFYEGIISKDEYEKIKTLSPDTYIHYRSICKYVDEEGDLSDISFKEDVNINEFKKLYDKGLKKSTTYSDLMDYFYEEQILECDS